MQILYIREGVQQYYIPEISVAGEQGRISLGITYRNDPDLPEPCTVNFTLAARSQALAVPVAFAFVTRTGFRIEAAKPSILYLDRGKKIARMSAKLGRESMRLILREKAQSINIGLEGGTTLTFAVPGRLAKDFEALQGELYP